MSNTDNKRLDINDNRITRRKFIKITGYGTLGTAAISGLSWQVLASEPALESTPFKRRPLIVKPVFIYSTPIRREQTSWRNWGGRRINL